MTNGAETAVNTAEALMSIATELVTERDLNQLLAKIVTAARKIVQADGGQISLLDTTKRNLCVEVFQYGSISTRKSDYPIIPLQRNGARNTSNVSVYAAFNGEPVTIDDVYQYSGFDFNEFYSFDQRTGYRTRSTLAIPMIDHQGVTIGVLQLINSLDSSIGKVAAFTSENVRIAQVFACQAAVAIENVQLLEENKRLIQVLNQTNENLAQENQKLRKTIEGTFDFSLIIGDSEPMHAVFNLMKKVVNSDATVLVRGETGTGKELVAQAIHFNSHRRNREFVTQNCAALPQDLLESELFGYKKGAFSGAMNDKKGLIQQAEGGTLFLDEIGDMPLTLQAKLLRVLQEKEVRPLGAVESVKINVRFVTATHHDLMKLVKDGKFREDLFYRLSIFPIVLPALRDRKEDLPALIQHFVDNIAEKYNKSVSGLSPASLDILIRHSYPGNIRELRNIIERAVLLVENNSHILPEHLPEEIIDRRQGFGRVEKRSVIAAQDTPLKDMMEQYEAQLIRDKLKECDWNQSRTAKELSMGRRTLIEKIQRYQIQKQ